MKNMKMTSLSLATAASLMGCGALSSTNANSDGSPSDLAPAGAPQILSFSGVAASENIGLTDASGNASVARWEVANSGNATYTCRFASPDSIATAAQAPCDGASGIQPLFTIPADATNGQKTLEVVATGQNGTSTTSRVTFYLHAELNNKSACNSNLSLDAAFATASNALGITALSPSFGDATKLAHPNKVVQLGDDSTFQIETLRRQLFLSSDKKLIAVTRKFVSDNNGCRNGFTIGHHRSITRAEYERTSFDCAAYVFSADGRAAVCIDENGQVLRRSTDALKPLRNALTHENNGYDQ